MSILLEQYKGAFPTWLAPTQIRLIPVDQESHGDYVDKLNDRFFDEGFRSDIDQREEKLGYKIREAQTQKIPYQLVLGDEEKTHNTLTYRRYGEKAQHTVSIEDFVSMIRDEVRSKKHYRSS